MYIAVCIYMYNIIIICLHVCIYTVGEPVHKVWHCQISE